MDTPETNLALAGYPANLKVGYRMSGCFLYLKKIYLSEICIFTLIINSYFDLLNEQPYSTANWCFIV